MTSRVEELQRMCDNINENGGLDSGEWHTALLAQIAQNLAVIADVMMADRKTENSSEKPNNCDTCRNKGFEGCEQPCLGCGCCGLYEPKDEPQICDTCRFELYCPEMCEGCCEWDSHYEPKDEPQICDTCRYYNSNIPCGSTPSACKEADKFAEEFVQGLKNLQMVVKTEPQTERSE